MLRQMLVVRRWRRQPKPRLLPLVTSWSTPQPGFFKQALFDSVQLRNQPANDCGEFTGSGNAKQYYEDTRGDLVNPERSEDEPRGTATLGCPAEHSSAVWHRQTFVELARLGGRERPPLRNHPA